MTMTVTDPLTADLPAQDSREQTEVAALVHAFARCWNEHDMAAFAELFDEDAQFVNVVGLWWRGRREIRQAHEFSHATMFRDSVLAIEETSVRFLAPQVAIARARWRLQGHVSPDGTPLPERQGLLVNVVQRRGGGWKIVDSQNTDVIAGALSRPQ